LSTVTKIFVVLLVVLSLLLTAATVTFVNTQQEFGTSLTNARSDADTQRALVQQLENRLGAERTQANDAYRLATAQIEAIKRDQNQIQQALIDRDAQLARLRGDVSLLQADNSRLTEALRASESSKVQLQQIVQDLRQTGDRRQTENAQLNAALNDLTSRLEVTERERRFLAEQLAEVRQQNEQLSSAARRAGIDLRQVVAQQTTGGDVRINGVIRNTRTIAGMEYATISVGSAEGVTRGMEFNIVDRETGNFLGVLTVDTVEANEATGRIRGERVAEVRPGAEVRTQL